MSLIKALFGADIICLSDVYRTVAQCSVNYGNSVFFGRIFGIEKLDVSSLAVFILIQLINMILSRP